MPRADAASRVTYRLAVASDDARGDCVTDFVAWAQGRVKDEGLRGLRIESLESGRPEMRQTLDRAEKRDARAGVGLGQGLGTAMTEQRRAAATCERY